MTKPEDAAKPEDVELLVLRFRDLVTTPGDTIQEHKKILNSASGYVWWGWWHKSGEAVPGSVFRRLNELASAAQSGFKIILFDSGHKEIRHAVCAEIHWDNSHKPISSRDKKQTPAYYRDQKYLAWFKVVQIDEPVEDPKKELANYTYLRVNEFFREQPSLYTPFYGKRVVGCDELKQQDRTMWFLRAARDGDASHEVSLLKGSQLKPCDFAETYMPSRSRHLLWVSDLHFGSHHAFPLVSDEVKYDLGQAIEMAVKKHHVDDLAGVIVSGDITWKADKAEFDHARGFFERISRSPSTLDNYCFAICPGNHDLAFTATPYLKEAAIHHASVPGLARRNYEEFYEDLFYIKPNDHLSLGRRFLLGGHFPLEVVCLNSSLLEQKKDWFQGTGFIGERQLEYVEKMFNWRIEQQNDDSEQPRPFRVVVMHHHLLPVTYAEEPKGGTSYSTVLDAERLARWLAKHRVDVLLHGHMHQPYYATLTKPIDVKKPDGPNHTFHIIGLGSTGVVRDHRGEFCNMFGVLSAMARALKVSIYGVTPGEEQSHLISTITVPRLR